MQGLELFDDDDDGTVFRDVILLALLGFVTIVVLLLPHLNPPAKVADARQPGNLFVELYWPDDMDTDVDLWVQAPGDRPVGYSNRGGAVFNLLRDDMGHINDTGKLNYEVAFSRGAPAGEYTVNLHLYRNNSTHRTVPAEVLVGLKRTEQAPVQIIHRKKLDLRYLGQEVTVVRFSLGDEANLLPGTIHDLPRPLRSGAGTTRTAVQGGGNG